MTDTYPSLNSHRWCRNSEFAFDAGAFDETLERPILGGRPVYAACGGVVEEAFDGLDDTDGDTDLEEIEAQYGEHARIDGNHVLIRHGGGELSLYAHLEKGERGGKARGGGGGRTAHRPGGEQRLQLGAPPPLPRHAGRYRGAGCSGGVR